MNIETTDNSPLLQECIEELINSKSMRGKEEPLGIIEAHGINYPPFRSEGNGVYICRLNDRFSSSLSFMVDARGRRETGSLETG